MFMAVGSASGLGWLCASGAVLLSVLRGARPAHAQSVEPPVPAATQASEAPSAASTMRPGRGMVLAHVSAGPHAFAVFFGRGQQPIAECPGECDFWAWPAKYR